jgi:hypothetical protein
MASETKFLWRRSSEGIHSSTNTGFPGRSRPVFDQTVLDRPIPSLASQPPLFRFPYSTWTSHAPSKDSLLRHPGRGRLLTWLRLGRHAHVLGRFRRHLKRPPQRPNHVSRGVACLAALARDRNRLRLPTHDRGRMQKCLHSDRSDLYHEHHILTSYLFFSGNVLHSFLDPYSRLRSQLSFLMRL